MKTAPKQALDYLSHTSEPEKDDQYLTVQCCDSFAVNPTQLLPCHGKSCFTC